MRKTRTITPHDLAPTRWVTVPYAARLTVNAALGLKFRVRLTGNATLEPPINGTSGQKVTLRVEWGATATLTLHANLVLVGSFTSPTASGSVSYLTLHYDEDAPAWEVVEVEGDGGGGGGAPTTADYLVKTADGVLSAERVVGDSTSNTANWATPGAVTFERAALTGDVTAPANSNTTTIAAGAVDQAMTSITGTPTGAKFLRDDWSWQTVSAAVPTAVATGDMLYASAASTWAIRTIGGEATCLRSISGVPQWGTLGYAGGGTDQTTWSQGQILYASAANTLAKLSIGGIGIPMVASAGGIPSWAVLSEVGGGTNQTTYSTGQILYASGANTLAKRTIGGDGTILTASGGVPTWASPAAATSFGVATGTSIAATGLIKSSSTSAGVGYALGAGGTVTQATSKSTGVTLDNVCGAVTMHNAALAAAALVSFTVTNSSVAAADAVIVNVKSGATADTYIVTVTAVAAGSFRIQVFNASGSSQSEAIVLTFAVIKAVTA